MNTQVFIHMYICMYIYIMAHICICRHMDEMVLVHVRWTCVFSIVVVSAITYRIQYIYISLGESLGEYHMIGPFPWLGNRQVEWGGSIFKRTLSHFVSERALTQHSHLSIVVGSTHTVYYSEEGFFWKLTIQIILNKGPGHVCLCTARYMYVCSFMCKYVY